MAYTQITPATDWYFKHENSPNSERPCTVYQIAVWAIQLDGEVVGLVSLRDPDAKRAVLVKPPALPGDYLHRDQLTGDELEHAKLS